MRIKCLYAILFIMIVALRNAYADSSYYRSEYRGLLSRFEKNTVALNYIIYYRSSQATADDVIGKSAPDVAEIVKSSHDLPRQRIGYYDRITSAGAFSRIEATFTLVSANHRLDAKDLKHVGLKLRKLRDDFFYPVSIPPFIQQSKYAGQREGDVVGINEKGAEVAFTGEGRSFFEQAEPVVTRFWGESHEKFLEEGTWTKDEKLMKVSGKIDETSDATA